MIAIPSLLLSTLTTFATPVVISEVRATREPGHLRVEVVGEGGIDPEEARTRIDGGRLLMVLGGTRVRTDNRSWSLEEGVGEIRAHRHPNEIELEVPLAGNGCAGPVELQGSPTGLTAVVGCEGMVRARSTRGAARATSEAPAADKIVDKTAEKTALEALVALPDGETGAKAAKPVAAATPAAKPVAVPTPKAASSEGALAAPKPVEAAASLASVAAAIAPKELALPAPSGDAAGATDKPVEAGPARLGAMSLPAVLLGGLAVAAYVVARRRRVPKLRQIQILETASLGPKRSLVVARVGEETLVLGTSEAGITLLRTSGESMAATLPMAMASLTGTAPLFNFSAAQALAQAQAPATVTAAASAAHLARESTAVGAMPAAPSGDGTVKAASGGSDASGQARAHAEEMAQPLTEALADIPDPEAPAEPSARGVTFRAIEGGMASLFGSRGAAPPAAGRSRATTARFDDILEDSLEDQELRRKLAAGMTTRVR